MDLARANRTQMNLIIFPETDGLDGGSAVDVFYLDFSKASDAVLLSMPVVEVGKFCLDGKTTGLVEKQADRLRQ